MVMALVAMVADGGGWRCPPMAAVVVAEECGPQLEKIFSDTSSEASDRLCKARSRQNATNTMEATTCGKHDRCC